MLDTLERSFDDWYLSQINNKPNQVANPIIKSNLELLIVHLVVHTGAVECEVCMLVCFAPGPCSKELDNIANFQVWFSRPESPNRLNSSRRLPVVRRILQRFITLNWKYSKPWFSPVSIISGFLYFVGNWLSKSQQTPSDPSPWGRKGNFVAQR